MKKAPRSTKKANKGSTKRTTKKAAPRAKRSTAKRAASKVAAGKRATKRPRAASKKRAAPPEPRVPGAQRGLASYALLDLPEGGMGADSGGQSGDIERLTANAGADSQSVRELSEEGQSFEAAVIDGVERALDPDQGEVTTREVPEDDVPREYLQQEQPGRG